MGEYWTLSQFLWFEKKPFVGINCAGASQSHGTLDSLLTKTQSHLSFDQCISPTALLQDIHTFSKCTIYRGFLTPLGKKLPLNFAERTPQLQFSTNNVIPLAVAALLLWLPQAIKVANTTAATMSVTTKATIASFGGKLLKLTHNASTTNCEMAFNLYLPPQTTTNPLHKVPLLIYLAGLTCTGDNGAEKGFFQHAASEKGIAILYPDTSPRKTNTWCTLHQWAGR